MLSNSEKDAVRFLNCCSVLEEETFQLYHTLARKINYVDVKSLLIGLAYDSLKHSKIVGELSKNIVKPELQVKDCKKQLGQLWKNIYGLSEKILKSEKILDDDLPSLLKDLANLEDQVSERYEIFLQPKTLQFITREISSNAHADLETSKSIFEGLIRDKDNHRDTLIAIIYYFATRELEMAKDNTPIVKYQNPDGWSRPLQF